MASFSDQERNFGNASVGISREPCSLNSASVGSAFKHPMDYLDPSMVHSISPVVCQDLELENMYAIAFNPQHKYAEQMIQQWKSKFSSDVEYLQQTQRLQLPKGTESSRLDEFAKGKGGNHMSANADWKVASESEGAQLGAAAKASPIDVSALDSVFNDVFETSDFVNRYSFIDIENVKFVNENSTFMGFWTMANLLSPLISLVLPLLLLVAPFVLLKIQGVAISFDAYLSILKSLLLKHSLGKAFASFDAASLNGLVYLLFSLAMYGIQTYQNIKSCIRFYKNIYTINTNLISIQTFLKTSLHNMKDFMVMNAGLSKYAGFCAHMSNQFDELSELQRLVADVKPFSFGINKMFEIGYLLKCYYGLQKYKTCLQYAVALEGYFDNMRAIKSLKPCEFNCEATIIEDQVYPPLSKRELCSPSVLPPSVLPPSVIPIKNTVDLSNNIIITGPNASGKTTILKTTAINIIFSQQFGAGYYSKCVLYPYSQIHSYLNIPDTSGRDSLFQAEARRCKEILDFVDQAEFKLCENMLDFVKNCTSESAKKTEASLRHFCIFDELFSGTNAEEATYASVGFLKYLQTYSNVDFILTTHFIDVPKTIETLSNKRIINMKMDATLEGNSIHFTYKLVPGISEIKAAKLILMQMGFPSVVFDAFSDDESDA
jgi:hypothetical protein